MQSNDSTLLDVAWAAGFIDGEGCFWMNRQIHKGRTRLTHFVGISVHQTKREPLDKLQRLFGGGIYKMITYKVNQVDGYQWRTHGSGARDVARAVRPYLLVKGPQADLIAEFYRIPPHNWGRRGVPDEEVARRDALYLAFRIANHRGTGPVITEVA